MVRLNSLTTVKGPNNAQLELKHVFAPSQYLPRLLANNKIVVSMGDEYDLTFFLFLCFYGTFLTVMHTKNKTYNLLDFTIYVLSNKMSNCPESVSIQYGSCFKSVPAPDR